MRFGAEVPSESPIPRIPPPPDEGLHSEAPASAFSRSRQAGDESTSRWFGLPKSLAILAILVLVTASGGIGAIAGARSRENHWKTLYNRAVADAADSEAESDKWQAATRASQQLSDRYHSDLQSLQDEVKASVGDLEHPKFTIWNVPQSLDGSHYLFGSVPDTFRWNLDIRSTHSPIKVLIMTSHDFACWHTDACYAHWRYWGPSRRIIASWDAGRGCAGYVFVITSTGPTTVTPRETITRDPADKGTGACRA
jgi:hypothetical protein